MEFKGTPGPWYWGDGFSETQEKYADCQLYGAEDEVVIPIRIDHHEPIWDVNDGYCDGELSEPEIFPNEYDRALIASSTGLLASCIELLARIESDIGNTPEGERAKAIITQALGGADHA